MTETLAYDMGTHLRVFSESYLMNINMTMFGWFSKYHCVLAVWTQVASALEGLSYILVIRAVY